MRRHKAHKGSRQANYGLADMTQPASNFDLRLDTRSRSVVRELSYGEGSEKLWGLAMKHRDL
jgi:hypothetical protein